MYLLDTNTCIEYLRRRNVRVKEQIELRRPREIRLCSIVVAELFHGAYRSAEPKKNLALVDEIVGTFLSLPFDDVAAEMFGDLRTKLERTGNPIGPYDLQIASIASVHSLTLVTHNVGEFARVSNLKIEDWQA